MYRRRRRSYRDHQNLITVRSCLIGIDISVCQWWSTNKERWMLLFNEFVPFWMLKNQREAGFRLHPHERRDIDYLLCSGCICHDDIMQRVTALMLCMPGPIFTQTLSLSARHGDQTSFWHPGSVQTATPPTSQYAPLPIAVPTAE